MRVLVSVVLIAALGIAGVVGLEWFGLITVQKEITAAQAGAGVGGVVAVVLLCWRSIAAWKQAEAANRSIEELSWSNMIDRFSKSIEQIDDAKSIPIRTAAIHTMKAIAIEFGEMRESTIDIFQSYIVHHASVAGDEVAWDRAVSDSSSIKTAVIRRQDLKAAVDAIFQIRNGYLKDRRIVLSGLNLRGFICNSDNVSNTEFFRSILSEADFSGKNLSLCDFRKTMLTNANFENANINRADFGGSRQQGAKFSNTSQSN